LPYSEEKKCKGCRRVLKLRRDGRITLCW